MLTKNCLIISPSPTQRVAARLVRDRETGSLAWRTLRRPGNHFTWYLQNRVPSSEESCGWCRICRSKGAFGAFSLFLKNLNLKILKEQTSAIYLVLPRRQWRDCAHHRRCCFPWWSKGVQLTTFVTHWQIWQGDIGIGQEFNLLKLWTPQLSALQPILISLHSPILEQTIFRPSRQVSDWTFLPFKNIGTWKECPPGAPTHRFIFTKGPSTKIECILYIITPSYKYRQAACLPMYILYKSV